MDTGRTSNGAIRKMNKRRGTNEELKRTQDQEKIVEKKIVRKFFVLFLLCALFYMLYRVAPFAMLTSRVTPLIQISAVTVSGNSYIDSSHIIAVTGIDTTSTFFSVSKDSVRTLVEAIPGIQRAKISRSIITRKVKVRVTERTADYMAIIDGGVFFLDTDGYMWPFNPGKYWEIPVVTGLRDTTDEFGRRSIYPRELERLQRVYSSLTGRKKGVGNRVMALDLSSPDMVSARLNGVIPEVRLQNATLGHARENVDKIVEILKTSDVDARMYIDLSYQNVAFIR